MTKSSIRGGWLGVATIVGTVSLLPSAPAIAEDEIMEEVVVTGSYIKRSSFDSASPLTIIDQAELQAEATPNLGEILSNQTFNYGTDFQTNTYAARGQGGVFSQANLRGLGPRATLQLIDGKRILTRNLNNSIPQVAIERIDILKDGASALYGTDAVAGVVNLITRKNFSGSEFSYFYTQDKDDDHHETVFDFIAGADTDDGHITVAASYRRRTALQQVERPKWLNPPAGFDRSGTGNPGDWLVPNRGVDGLLNGTTTRHVDPGCGTATSISPGGANPELMFNFLSGDPNGPVATATNCRFHFGQTWNYMNPTENYNGWINFQYQFTDNLSNEIDVIFTKQFTDSRGSPQNPGGRTEEFPIVLGDHPGNPFRAFYDANGDGLIDTGELLYALDANGDGIPDRGSVDLNGDGINDVLLAADPFDSTQGIAFNEDVDVAALRIFSMIGLLPGANQPTSLNGDGSNTGNSTYTQTNFRVTDTLTYVFPDSSWEVQLIMNYNQGEFVFEVKNTSQSALVQGLNGNLKADPTDATTSYWNPFSTQALNCVNRICSSTGVPTFVNTVSVLDAVNIQDHDITDSLFWSVDVIATGDLMELPAGTLAAAFGLQYRDTEVEVDLNGPNNACD
ncbi:MAG: TonB-dependent receptor plug domain-containing protein, partial [Proteobacteria bacterium]|nr:TonB-dependent receptor plug domain-containing protein [Pseudomonadota bacterium]